MAESAHYGESERRLDLPEFNAIYQQLRERLMEQLRDVDANILITVVSQHGGRVPRVPPQFFSDWPDTYNRGTWYKTWAKAELPEALPERTP